MAARDVPLAGAPVTRCPAAAAGGDRAPFGGEDEQDDALAELEEDEAEVHEGVREGVRDGEREGPERGERVGEEDEELEADRCR